MTVLTSSRASLTRLDLVQATDTPRRFRFRFRIVRRAV
jgi:hypothetical protein